jgi:hypothetical protein
MSGIKIDLFTHTCYVYVLISNNLPQLNPRLLLLYIFFISATVHAQHHIKMAASVDAASKTIRVQQEITYHNQTNDILFSVVLNDWNNAYSGKDTPLAKRFSDEYVRAFHLAKDEERGSTGINSLTDKEGVMLTYIRPIGHPDIIEIQSPKPIYPNQEFIITIAYDVQIPNSRFTRFGYDDKGNFILRNWYLSPARIQNNTFVLYSNENLDDIANDISDFDVTLTVPTGMKAATDLQAVNKSATETGDIYFFSGKARSDFSLTLETESTYKVYSTPIAEVTANLKEARTTDVQRAVIIDQVVNFTNDHLGAYPHRKILISQADYDRNPMYGLNQLPAFLSPFPDSFLYEVRFLKTYINTYLKNTLRLDPRKDSYIYDGIQVYLMMKYMDEYHPDKHMMGSLSTWGILKGFNLFQVDFNGQYNYLYLLMARKNLDQPIGDPKNTFIKFNEQIAGKYRAGLSLNYLDDYLGDNAVPQSIAEFYSLNNSRQTDRQDFENIVKSKTSKETEWFFDTVVGTRKLIDYKFGDVKKDKDSVQVTIKNNTGTVVPVSLYGINKGEVEFKQWIENIKTDSTLTLPRLNAEKLVLNYNNEIPEYNARNNWKSLNGMFNKPFKFTFFQDLENPHYNQVFYVPSFVFNLYDGVSVGMRFHNKSLLEKPFIFDIEPTYSTKTGNLIGSFSFLYNQYLRETKLYNIRYGISASTYHYAPDAAYIKFTPSIQFRIREDDFRKNKKQYIMFRHVTVDRENSILAATDEQNENYSVFNARYSGVESEITRHYNFFTDVQVAGDFGKLSGEVQYRRLFNDNRQINLRLYAGTFLYRRTTSEFFSFGLDRPTDYMFDYNLYGRSEETGLFSQQYVMAEGGFKSKLDTRYANQWMTSLNGSFNIWNWIEVYGDAGLFKNRYDSAKFVYDSGIRLNLVPDYFELYFPVYSSNGFELNDSSYGEKVRFVVTISPGTLINLFTRKWL